MNIPAQAVMKFSCKVAGGLMKEGSAGIVKPIEHVKNKYELGVTSVAAKFHNGEIPVRIFNPTDNDVRIGK